MGRTFPQPASVLTAAPDLVALVVELHRKVDALTALVERERGPVVSLSPADRDRLSRMLPAIAGVFGSALLIVRELFERDSPALRLVLVGLNAKQVGRLSALDAASAAATQLLEAQRSNRPLSPKTLDHYTEQFAALTTQREHMRTVVAQWWTLLEERPH